MVAPMSKAVEQKVREEQQRFNAARPELWKTYPNRHVIFLAGEVKGAYGNALNAYRDALTKFGSAGGFVIAQVTKEPEVWHIYPSA